MQHQKILKTFTGLKCISLTLQELNGSRLTQETAFCRYE